MEKSHTKFRHPVKSRQDKRPPGQKVARRKTTMLRSNKEKSLLSKKHFTINLQEICRPDKNNLGKNPPRQKTILTNSHLEEKLHGK